MKILTAAQMREVDRLTIERGIPGIILMENAGSRVVDFLLNLDLRHVVVVCGKGNNGGDGFVVARQLFTRKLCAKLTVVELFEPTALSGDALSNRRMLDACGCPVLRELPNEANLATVVVDAILGTGLTGSAKGPALDAIRSINDKFPLAKKIAVDIPSGLPSDASNPTGEFVRADYTITFTASKPSHSLSPIYESVGQLTVVPIGTPDELVNSKLNLTNQSDIRYLFAKRIPNSNKGMYGHVLMVGGSFGKSGAPAMSALASYRIGAGLVTVAIPESILTAVASFRPELMTEPLGDPAQVLKLLEKMAVLAIGPGMGSSKEVVRLVKTLYDQAEVPAVVDADALNALAGNLPHTDRIRILSPHPGEMSRPPASRSKTSKPIGYRLPRNFPARAGQPSSLKVTAQSSRFPTVRPGSIQLALPPWRRVVRATFSRA